MGLPEGRVTFLFTDIEGSTQLLQALGEAYPGVLARHHEIIRAAVDRQDGHVIGTEGDAFAVAFHRPEDAVQAAVDAQRALAAEPWTTGDDVRVRMGVHTGPVVRNETGYVGMALHETARIAAAAHGGQVVVSPETERRALGLPREIGFASLGAHRLKDLPEPLMLFQVVHPELADDFPALRSQPAVVSTLPKPRTTFLGRSAEVEAVRAAVASARLVTLVGPGGAGKTRLAIESLAPMPADVRDGIWFVDLAGAADDTEVLRAWASALDLRPEQDALGTIAEFLRTQDGIIVADNCEHVIDAAAEIVDAILESTTDIRIVATSRELLHLSGEVAVPVGALDGSEAEQLFLRRAEDALPGYQPSSEDLAAISRICEAVDRLPLAIELAAARAGALGARGIEAHLSTRFTLLAGTRRGGAERHRTLHASIGWSYDLLPPNVQAAFRRIAVLPRGFLLEPASVAVADTGGTLDALGQLVEKSLLNVTHSEDGAEYAMLESLQSFALERLAAEDDADAAWRRLLAWTTDLTARFSAGIRARGWREPLALLQTHGRTMRATTRWALANGEVQAAARIVGDLEWFWLLDPDYVDGMNLCMEVAAALPDEVETLTEARAVVAAARAASAVGASTRAVLDRATRAVERCGGGDPLCVAFRVQETVDNLPLTPDSSTVLQDAEATLRAAAEAHGGIDAWATLLLVARCWHDLDPARETALVTEVGAIAEALDHDVLRYLRSFSASYRSNDLGQLDAIPMALGIARTLNAPLLVDACTSTIGRLLLYSGDYEAAAPYLEQREEFCRRTGDRFGYHDVLQDRLRLSLWSGDIPTALEQADELVALTERVYGAGGWQADYAAQLVARVMVAAGRLDDADRHADQCEAASASAHPAAWMDIRATIALERGDRDTALLHLRRAIERTEEPDASLRHTFLLAMGTVAALMPPIHAEQAARLFGAAGPRSPWAPPWRYRLDEAIAESKGSLGNERYEKLYAEGATMTFEEAVAIAAVRS